MNKYVWVEVEVVEHDNIASGRMAIRKIQQLVPIKEVKSKSSDYAETPDIDDIVELPL